MTLRDLLAWMREGEGTYLVQGFVQAWEALAARRADPAFADPEESPVPGTPPLPADGVAWGGGPCFPLGECENAVLPVG